MEQYIKQNPPAGGCFACFCNAEEGLSILSTDHEFSIAALLEKHFWFRREDFRDDQSLCPSCWNQLDSFHRFYLIVEANHTKTNEIKQECEVVTVLCEEDTKLQLDVELESLKCSDADASSSSDDDYKPEDSSEEDDVPLKAIEQQIKLENNGGVRQKRKYTKRKESGDPPKQPLVTRAEREAEWAVKDDFIKTHVQLNCEQCVADFDSFAAFQKHMLKVHDTRKAPVLCCGKRFTRKDDLVKHVQREQNPDIFQCDICKKNFAQSGGLAKHKEQMHGPEELKTHACSVCPKRFIRQSQLEYHMKGHENVETGKFQCSVCGKRYPHQSSLNSHIKMYHTRPTDFICDVCAKGFYSKAEFTRHKKEHELTSAELRKQCDICLNWFKTERNLLVHYRRHKQRPVTCDLCGHVAPNKRAWSSHIKRVHSETKPAFACDECGKEFRRAVNLKEHKVSHTGEGALYMCNFCPRTFNSNGNMFSHRKKMHPKEWLELKNSLYAT